VYASAPQQLLVEGYFTSAYSQPVTGLQRPNRYGGQQGDGSEYWVGPWPARRRACCCCSCCGVLLDQGHYLGLGRQVQAGIARCWPGLD
jgi:hypothetical protein